MPGIKARMCEEDAICGGDIEQRYQADALQTDYTDGLSMELADWRFNVRASNTEPVVRLNVETRADESLMQSKRDELLQMMGDSGQ
ncbi:MAG: hypothetical protein GY727_10525 [Gammaproteobacteria bacterium]|nr:hypothetical protein [Gammaproteobacteria bacterium]MCP4088545.1 hypothetical protein [Gammaproteobacteria bacterium]MCP4276715.1 hypothetical protein [Gammaproteobacteria bacterium]MCP4832424.1 hypothetical protein [Gammaproteobacteria bacterium]MCP4929865.1 hypothetical protein [Gammaproteobacteria bacterium]